MMSKDSPERQVRYLLTWPASLEKAVAAAAGERTMSIAAWLRLAALEKLERDNRKARR